MKTFPEVVRARAIFCLEPNAAAAAGLKISDLEQLVAGRFHPTREQNVALALYWGIAVPPGYLATRKAA